MKPFNLNRKYRLFTIKWYGHQLATVDPMRNIYFIAFLLLLGSNLQVSGQQDVSRSEKSFSRIKVKEGTRDVSLTNAYNKRWKMRVNFPKTTEEKTGLIIALHWAGGDNAYREFNDCLILPGLKALNTIIVSPQDENQLWSTGNNIDKVIFIVENSQKYWNVDPEKIAVVGYSNGGNGSWYYAQHYPELFSAAIPMASAYPVNQKIEIPLYVIHGANDELFRLDRTKKYIDRTKHQGTELIWVVNDKLSHFEGCAYIANLKNAGEWLNELWKKK